jgi:hypothetical protein
MGDPGRHTIPAVINQICRCDLLVHLGQQRHGQHGHQVAAAEPADLAFHAALLMRAGRTGMQTNESNP